ncbi:MAG: tRNA1(Val) (adenine(37)-N6)-methyltransferase [Clostridia bacterium]|nr:tRNA1(Val) (adenine(37)-N6)-methyltransferase [Clostridia bacterium]
MDELVKENERIDDLQFRGLKLIQNPESFCFGTDAVLLADFATVKKNALVCDLGTGTGILPILLYGRHEFTHCDAVEIQPDMAEMASRSMRLNNLEDKITVHHGDLRRVKDFLPSCAYSTVVCNPPYKKDGSGEHNHDENRATSRHEAACTLDDVCAAAKYLLKNGGRFAMINHSDRIVDIFETMRKYNLEPKRCRPVQSRPNTSAYVVLIEAVKDGKPYMNWESTLCIYDEAGNLNFEMSKIYHLEEE